MTTVPEGTPPAYSPSSPALSFQIHAEDKQGHRARAGTLHLPHGPVRTPVFMPVGTKASIKGIAPRQLLSAQAYEDDVVPEICLCNTFHCAIQPTTELLDAVGGTHKFMGWPNNLLTDSGGFQMVSLLKLSRVEEAGVTFRSPVDGTEMLLTPEQSIEHQNRIGADIIMALDDVVSSVDPNAQRMEVASERTVRWLDRCIAAHRRPTDQNLFGIVQGGLDVSPGGMREKCVRDLVQRNLPGYAIGGLAGGEGKDDFWRVVSLCAKALPRDKPKYVMGVGYPLDLVICVALGCDMFDCVYPTRTARFGVALIPSGILKMKSKAVSSDMRQVEQGCPCVACTRYNRAQLSAMFKAGASAAAQALTLHNIAYMMRLMRSMRESIMKGTFPDFVNDFLRTMFLEEGLEVPNWVKEALEGAGLSLASCIPS
jgi:tRNA-guanine transglycosylase